MKKQLLCTAVLAAIGATASTSASAALASDALLNFDSFTTTTTTSGSVFVTGGSYFAMDTNGSGSFTKTERTGLVQNDGIAVNTIQTASGSHSGAPGCTDGVGTCNNTGEFPGIDQAWNFFGNTGMHGTNSASTVLSAVGDTATLDFSGWTVDWNGGEISMGAGGSGGVATVNCAAASGCVAGSAFTMVYDATVPATDPGFGGVAYQLTLVGTIGTQSAIPVPAAVWLFGSGLLGLVGVARRRKAA